jgi:hypothetical protein
MINGLIGSGQLSLSAWEPYVHSNAEQAQSLERRWRRFLENTRVCVEKLYLPLVIAALNDWQKHRLYLAIDTTVLWNRFCMIHISVVCCGRAIPLLLFLDSKSGAFELEDSRLRNAKSLERLYLIAALALLYSTTQGMAVQVAGLRQHVDPHWNRGLSYLKIGLRWLKGVLNKGRQLLTPISLLPQDPQPCFASNKTRQNNCDRIWFSRIYSLECRA